MCFRGPRTAKSSNTYAQLESCSLGPLPFAKNDHFAMFPTFSLDGRDNDPILLTNIVKFHTKIQHARKGASPPVFQHLTARAVPLAEQPIYRRSLRNCLQSFPLTQLNATRCQSIQLRSGFQNYATLQNRRQFLHSAGASAKAAVAVPYFFSTAQEEVYSHMEMLNVCHLVGISPRLGRSLQWDNQTESIVGDEA